MFSKSLVTSEFLPQTTPIHTESDQIRLPAIRRYNRKSWIRSLNRVDDIVGNTLDDGNNDIVSDKSVSRFDGTDNIFIDDDRDLLADIAENTLDLIDDIITSRCNTVPNLNNSLDNSLWCLNKAAIINGVYNGGYFS